MATLRPVTDKQQWEDFLAQHDASVLQSWAWGEAQAAYGFAIHRFGLWEGEEVRAVGLFLVYTVNFGMTYWYCPRGPVGTLDAIAELLVLVGQEAKKAGAIFLRYDAARDIPTDKFSGTVRIADKNPQPQHTLLVDLSQTEEALLASFRPSTRRHVLKAQKRNLSVRTGHTPADVDAFYDLLAATARRQGFTPHTRAYYRAMLAQMGAAEQATVVLVEDTGKLLAGLILTMYGKHAIYVHGASAPDAHRFSAPTFAQWEAMRIARSRGCTTYDLGGVAGLSVAKHAAYTTKETPPLEAFDERDPWFGITQFKLGFRGTYTTYPSAHDVVLASFGYRVFRTLKRLRHLF